MSRNKRLLWNLRTVKKKHFKFCANKVLRCMPIHSIFCQHKMKSILLGWIESLQISWAWKLCLRFFFLWTHHLKDWLLSEVKINELIKEKLEFHPRRYPTFSIIPGCPWNIQRSSVTLYKIIALLGKSLCFALSLVFFF